MRHSSVFLVMLVVSMVVFLPAAAILPPMPASPEQTAELSAAYLLRLQSGNQLQTVNFLTPEVDSAFISPDGQSAVIWIALRTPSGRILGTEPGMVLANLTSNGWQVLLAGDPNYEQTLSSLPPEMLPAERQPALSAPSNETTAVTEALTGYYLPYAAGTAHWLEGSISHFQSIPALGYPSCSSTYCRYAYDFTDYGHYPLLASKEGYVWGSRDSCPDGGTSCTNYIALSDTNGSTYQIYLHLSQGTIPDKLTPGTYVKRGQYLGDTDDTGYSTSNHVHFMVTNSISLQSDGYAWGTSIDIRFADVPINNGIPRNCYEIRYFATYDGATQCTGSLANPDQIYDLYVSGNVGAYPASGTVQRPAPGITVAPGSNPLMDATATAIDDVSVKAVRMIAKINGQWVEIGPKVTQPAAPNFYDWDINLCDVGPLNGTYEMALRVWDYEGNVTGPLDPRLVNVDQACPGQVYLPFIRR